jgi:uncharacterized protein with GYD domain
MVVVERVTTRRIP